MNREKIIATLSTIFSEKFEIENPGMDENLGDAYEFDSIDAIELLREIEIMLESKLTREEKKNAMDIRTFGQIITYIEELSAVRNNGEAIEKSQAPKMES